MIKLINLKTSDLNKFLINEILKLKNSHWNKGLISQKSYFYKNVYQKDSHMLLYFNKILCGYVLLRKRKCVYKNRNLSYLHFDTFIIKKKFRGRKLALVLMNFINSYIKFNKTFSILYCNKDLVKFYKKFDWKLANYSHFKLEIKKSDEKHIMIYK